MAGVKRTAATRGAYYRIGQNIRKHRLRCGMTQQELADLIGKNRADINWIENGRSCLRIGSVYRVMKVLDMDIDDTFPSVEEITLLQDSEWLNHVKKWEEE